MSIIKITIEKDDQEIFRNYDEKVFENLLDPEISDHIKEMIDTLNNKETSF